MVDTWSEIIFRFSFPFEVVLTAGCAIVYFEAGFRNSGIWTFKVFLVELGATCGLIFLMFWPAYFAGKTWTMYATVWHVLVNLFVQAISLSVYWWVTRDKTKQPTSD